MLPEAVQMRFNKGVLEYRSLIIMERSVYNEDGSGHDELYLDYSKLYTEWKPVLEKEQEDDAEL